MNHEFHFNNLKIHHIGYLVQKIEKAKPLFSMMGYQVEQDTSFDAHRNIDICFLVKDGYRVELVEPKSSDSVVYKLRKKLGNTPYHICYEVDHLESAIDALRSQHFVICDPPCSAPALDGKRVVFMVHAAMGMIELVEH